MFYSAWCVGVLLMDQGNGERSGRMTSFWILLGLGRRYSVLLRLGFFLPHGEAEL